MSHELLQEAKAHAQGNLSRAISSIEATFFSNESAPLIALLLGAMPWHDVWKFR